MASNQQKLLFVYNADSGLFNTITDIAHKIISPKTYACHLCELTHGYFKVRESWVKFLQQLDLDCEFLHRDELFAQYGIEGKALPVIYLKQGDNLVIWMTKETIEQFDRIEELIAFMQKKLNEL
ncbi:MAG: hypothetical protein OEY87_10440 [Gammaproteobacteria bacterium]|nr:hypothetical protein [Gammaproteobacteria bacterium]MDH5736527.1 hypothetical protein [Gammaproteobacteria bacterium]